MGSFLRGLFKNELGKIEYSAREWLVMRVGFVLLVWAATWQNQWIPFRISITEFKELRDPNGLASWFDLSWLANSTATVIVVWLFLTLSLLYISGRLPLLATGGLFFIHAMVGAIHNSPRGHHHATQVVGMILMGQFGFFPLAFCETKIFLQKE